MDESERRELLEALQNVKELVDTAFPLESGVVRDQVLAMLAVTTLQESMLKKHAGDGVARFDFKPVIEWINQIFVEYKAIQRENVLAQRQRIAAQLTEIGARKGKDWAWNAYEEFMECTRKTRMFPGETGLPAGWEHEGPPKGEQEKR